MNPLHIPLSSLPGPVPMWTPGVFRVPDGATYYPVAIYCPAEDGTMWVMEANNLGRPPIHLAAFASDVFVDLSPPPIVGGHPTRIDALPILVAMLARAMGHPEGQHVFRTGSMRPDAWALETWAHGADVSTFTLFTHDIGAPHDGTQRGGWTMAATETREIIRRLPRIPALASIPLTDPNAHRLALSALFAARVWETA